MAAALRASEACSLSTAAAPTSSESTHELSLWHLSCLHTCTAMGQNILKLHHFSFLKVLLIGQTGNNQSSLCEVCRVIHITRFHWEVRNWYVFLTLNRNTMVDANPSATYSHSSSSGRWWVVLLTQRDDGQPLEREQERTTFVVYVVPPPYTDWRGESGDRCLTTPSRPQLWPLSHPQFVLVAIVTDLNTWVTQRISAY